MSVLEVKDLDTVFLTSTGPVHAVRGVSFSVAANETVAIVGESGSGKSVTSLSIMRLLSRHFAQLSGSIRFNGKDLLTLSEREMRKLRGSAISMIFQEPMTSLNPVLTIGRQITEPLRLHQKMTRDQANTRAVELLRMVGISSPERRLADYPHQFSGGMRQRVMIAIALACSPRLLIADEPTTALDVTVQAQVLDLMREIKGNLDSAIMLITHDLGVVAEMADRVVVMYAGRVVETGDVRALFANPQHPYTRGLLDAVPKLGSSQTAAKRERLNEIPGTVPSPRVQLPGCSFAPRCSRRTDLCTQLRPELAESRPGQMAACHHPVGENMLEVFV